MSISEKLTRIAENEQKVYDKGARDGAQAEYDRFWDSWQYYGERTRYDSAFLGEKPGRSYWDDVTFRPKYDIKPTSMNACFRYLCVTDLEALLEACGVVLDTSGCTSFGLLFGEAKCTVIPPIDVTGLGSGGTVSSLFGGCYYLKTLRRLTVREDLKYTVNMFQRCDVLENLEIGGVIGNDINFQWSTKLTHDSLMSIIGALADKSGDESGTVWTVTLGEENIAKLSDEDKNIAVQKGWVLG